MGKLGLGNFQCRLDSKDIYFFDSSYWRARKEERLKKQEEINAIDIEEYIYQKLKVYPQEGLSRHSDVVNRYLGIKYGVRMWTSYGVYRNEINQYGEYSDECLYSFDSLGELCSYFGITEQYYYTYFIDVRGKVEDVGIIVKNISYQYHIKIIS